MKRVGFILAFIATKLFWTLSWCKTVSYYTYFRVRIHVCQLWLYTLEVAGSFAGRLPIKCDPHWLRRAETTNEIDKRGCRVRLVQNLYLVVSQSQARSLCNKTAT